MANDKAITLIEEQEWLGRTADLLQPAVQDALQRSGQLKDILHGTWLGHPLHPVLTDIPVGAWTAALVLDAAEMISGNDGVGSAADLTVGVGLAGALGAALTGLTDWSETDGRAKKIGLMHGLLNFTATGLYATSLAMRRGKSRRTGIALSMLGYAIASASAYLGGHLVFGEQIGVDHTATSDAGKPSRYTPVIAESALAENKPKRVTVEGIALVLVKRRGRIHALTATCPHLGGPLDEGELDDEGIRCPWHGSHFCLDDGSVLGGPATQPARRYDVRVMQGQVEVRAGR